MVPDRGTCSAPTPAAAAPSQPPRLVEQWRPLALDRGHSQDTAAVSVDWSGIGDILNRFLKTIKNVPDPQLKMSQIPLVILLVDAEIVAERLSSAAAALA